MSELTDKLRARQTGNPFVQYELASAADRIEELEEAYSELSAHAKAEGEVIEELKATSKHYQDAAIKMDADLIELLCPALDVLNDPEYGWVIGDHTGHTLAMTLVARIKELEAALHAANNRSEGLEIDLTYVRDKLNKHDKLNKYEEPHTSPLSDEGFIRASGDLTDE